jgi:polygalacturonase
MDISSCENVLLYRCTVNAGDDGICMKSSDRNPAGGPAGLENVIIAECTVYHAHGGFVIGSNTDAGMRNLWATHCDYIGTDTGIRVKSGLGHGGRVQDVYIDHIFMKDIVNQAIVFDTYYENTPVSAAAVRTPRSKDAAKVPEFTDFHISDVYCHGAGEAISLRGLPQQPVHRIMIENSVIEARKGVHATDAADITLSNVRIVTPETPILTEKHTSGIRVIN